MMTVRTTKRGIGGTRLASLAILLASSIATGCYRYVPINLTTAPTEHAVRAHLSEPARQRFWALVSPGRPFLDGRFVQVRGDSALMAVSIRDSEEMSEFQQQVVLHRDDIVWLQTREVDRLRTSIAGGLVVATATALIVRVLTGKAGGGPYPPRDDGQTEAIVPVFGRAGR
jgi:hypothetical protein